MAERTTPFRNVKDGEGQNPIDRLKSEVDQLIGDVDFEAMSQKVKDFGRENPVALAVAALTVGVAAGILMRKSIPSTSSDFS
jgi:hypothetical protein